MFFITRFSGKMPKWQSHTVKKEFNAFRFPNFSRIRTNRETGNFASAMKIQASNFLPPCLSAILCQTQRGKVVAALFLFSAIISALN